MKFFDGYEVKEGSLKLDAARGTNGSGMIKFSSAREAGRAVRELVSAPYSLSRPSCAC
jgi:hypothetical protein